MNAPSVTADATLPRSRLMAGAVIFVTGQLAPLTIPWVASSSLPASWKTALSGLLLLGVPELAILLAVVVLGRAGFDALKSRLLGWAKGALLPEKVSRGRYHVGLVLFVIPPLYGWLSPYFHESTAALVQNRIVLAIAGDLVLIISLFLLGGKFWDKLRALFLYDAEVTFPPSAGETTS